MFLINNPDLVSITDPVSKLVEYEFQHYGTKGENERDDLYRNIWSFLCGKNHDFDKDIHHLDHDSSNTFFRNLVLIASELQEIAAFQHNINEILSGADSEILDFKDEILGIYKLSSEDTIKKIDECINRIGDKIETLEDNEEDRYKLLNGLVEFLTKMEEKYKKAAVLGAEVSFHVKKRTLWLKEYC